MFRNKFVANKIRFQACCEIFLTPIPMRDIDVCVC